MKIKRLYLSFKRSFIPRFFSSRDMLKLLLIDGIRVGKMTIFYDPASIIVDSSRPELLSIGEYCKITTGVSILTHDYSRSVVRRVYGDLFGEARRTVIGNNVFIGIKAIILMGSVIGDNCIIGAGSVVSGTFSANQVIAGNPAKVIMSLDEYYQKKKKRYLSEARQYVLDFIDFHKRTPKISEMGHFFPLFMTRSKMDLVKCNISLKLNGDEEQEILEWFLSTSPIFNGFEEFLRYCNNQNVNE